MLIRYPLQSYNPKTLIKVSLYGGGWALAAPHKCLCQPHPTSGGGTDGQTDGQRQINIPQIFLRKSGV